jgi:hypothetical protein
MKGSKNREEAPGNPEVVKSPPQKPRLPQNLQCPTTLASSQSTIKPALRCLRRTSLQLQYASSEDPSIQSLFDLESPVRTTNASKHPQGQSRPDQGFRTPSSALSILLASVIIALRSLRAIASLPVSMLSAASTTLAMIDSLSLRYSFSLAAGSDGADSRNLVAGGRYWVRKILDNA